MNASVSLELQLSYMKSICLFLIGKIFIFGAWLLCYSKRLLNFEIMIVSIMKLVYKTNYVILRQYSSYEACFLAKLGEN